MGLVRLDVTEQISDSGLPNDLREVLRNAPSPSNWVLVV